MFYYNCIMPWSTHTFYTALRYGLLPTQLIYLHPLRILQNKAVRLTPGSDAEHPTSCTYKIYNKIKLNDMVKMQLGMLVRRHFNNDLPSNLIGYFTNANKSHSIATRRHTIGYNYHIPRYRSSKLQRSIKYLGVSVWNSIPLDIRKCYSRSFKKRFKKLLTEGF